jgi:hypothetical protein
VSENVLKSKLVIMTAISCRRGEEETENADESRSSGGEGRVFNKTMNIRAPSSNSSIPVFSEVQNS